MNFYHLVQDVEQLQRFQQLCRDAIQTASSHHNALLPALMINMALRPKYFLPILNET